MRKTLLLVLLCVILSPFALAYAGRDRVWIPRPNGRQPWLGANVRAYETGQNCGACLTGGDAAVEEGNGTYYWSDIDTAGFYDLYANGRQVAEDFYLGLGQVAATQDSLTVTDYLETPIMNVTNSLWYQYLDTQKRYEVVPHWTIGIALEDVVKETAYAAAESLLAHGYAGTFMVNTHFAAMRYAGWPDSVGTPVDSNDVRNLARLGMEIGDHSATHSLTRGMSLAAYRASFDSSRAALVRWTGRAPRVFFKPGIGGAAQGMVLVDTTLLNVLPEYFDYSDVGTPSFSYQPDASTRFSTSLAAVTNASAYVEGIVDPQNLVTQFATTHTVPGLPSTLAVQMRDGFLPIMRFHLNSGHDINVLNYLVGWAAAHNVRLVPVSGVGDYLYRREHKSPTGNMVFDSELRQDIDGDGTIEAFDGATSAQRYVLATPCGSGVAARLVPWYIINANIGLGGGNVYPGKRYEVSWWVKSVDRDSAVAAYPDTVALSVVLSDWRGTATTTTTYASLTDSAWTPMSTTFTAGDTTGVAWKAYMFVGPGYGGVVNSDGTPNTGTNLSGQDTVLVACPCVTEVDQSKASTLLSGFESFFTSTDGDTLYVRTPAGWKGLATD